MLLESVMDECGHEPLPHRAAFGAVRGMSVAATIPCHQGEPNDIAIERGANRATEDAAQSFLARPAEIDLGRGHHAASAMMRRNSAQIA
jgi:hypothetical protein